MQNQTNKLQGIQRYYQRTKQGEYSNNYYIEPRETCPLYVLNSDDRFVPFGGGDYDNPDVGEVIYVSGNDVKTRRWTWRQGENSKVDETIKNAFIPLDGFTENKESILKLQKEFSDILTSMGVECTLGFIDKDHTEFEF